MTSKIHLTSTNNLAPYKKRSTSQMRSVKNNKSSIESEPITIKNKMILYSY